MTPQIDRHPRETLDRLLGVLAADPAVKSVHIGGSLARGEDDAYSDLDLWVEGEKWNPECLGGQFLVATKSEIAGMPFIHGVAVGGTIIDLIHSAPKWEGCARLDLPAPTPMPPAPLPGCGLVDEFWALSLKHRKNFMRGYEKLVPFGLDFDRRLLFRAWAMSETGSDPGPNAFNLFTLKSLHDAVLTPRRMALLGMPLRTREEILAAVEAYREEMTRLYPVPSALELTVRALGLAN